MREVVYDMIVALRVRGVAEGQQLNPQTPKVMKDHPQSTLLPAPRMDYSFRALRTELEISSAGEQGCVGASPLRNSSTTIRAPKQILMHFCIRSRIESR